MDYYFGQHTSSANNSFNGGFFDPSSNPVYRNSANKSSDGFSSSDSSPKSVHLNNFRTSHESLTSSLPQPAVNYRQDSGIEPKSDAMMFAFNELSDFNEMSESNSSESTG